MLKTRLVRRERRGTSNHLAWADEGRRVDSVRGSVMFGFKFFPFSKEKCRNCRTELGSLSDTKAIFSTDGSRYCKCGNCGRFNKYSMDTGNVTLVPKSKEEAISGVSLRKG